MSQSVTDIDSAITQELIRRIGADRFELWFADQRAIRMTTDKLLILAPDQFTLERIRTQFGSEIRAAAHQLIGHKVPINYQLADQVPMPAGTEEAEELPTAPDGAAATPLPTLPHRATKGRFDLRRFQFGENNALPKTAISQLLQRPGSTSPIVLCGPIGCGKTHLLQGAVAAARSSARYQRCVYLSAEQFTANFIEALQGRGIPIFRRKCRGLDLLALDDLQFLKGKRATLVELQHTVDALLRDGKQLLVAADRPIKDLGFLGPELSNRFASGLACTLELPTLESRLNILRQTIKDRQQFVAHDVLQLVAQNMTGDVRQLFGAVNLICAAQLASGTALSAETCKRVLRDLFQSNRQLISIDKIESAVCGICGVQPGELRSNQRTKRISSARMLAMFLSRKLTSAAFSEIGQHFGGRSHSTVISAQRKVLEWMQDNRSVPVAQSACQIEEVLRRIESQLRAG